MHGSALWKTEETIVGWPRLLRSDSPDLVAVTFYLTLSPFTSPDQVRELLRKGDVLVVWRLDRLGRSLKHLIELMAELEHAGIGFRSLQEHIDTTSPGGKLVFHIFGALAEFERNLIQERTKAGLEAARARGRKGGRPKRLNVQQRALALDLYTQRKHTVEEICRTLGISKPTLYAYVRGASSSKP